ncbi:metal-dependent hydrolase [Lutispora sp.]|uniref:metal-dependent hydrolase n=1 Tax=Lutispora sp. TaxID=2828727 RepID=UPI0035638236
MKVRFIGHSCFLVEDGKYSLLFDPFITDNPVAAVKASEVNPTHIFVSHYHGDHKGDALDIARRTNATIFTTNEIGIEFKKSHDNVVAGHIGGKAKTDFGSVKYFQAFHGSGIEGGHACGFIVDVMGKKIYHAGDTGLTKDMELLKKHNIHVALLPIGDFYTMGPEDALEAVKMIKPKYVIPMHYNTFPLLKQDPEAFAKAVADETSSKAIVLKPGQSVDL